MVPWVHPSQRPKRHRDRFSRFCTARRRLSLYFTIGRPSPPLNIDASHGDLDAHLIHGFLGPAESSAQTPSRSVEPFLQGSLYCDRQTDRETDHATRSVTIGHIYVHSTAMRPNHDSRIYRRDQGRDLHTGATVHPRATVHPWVKVRLVSKFSTTGPQYTHRAKVHLTKQIFDLRHTLISKS